MRKKLIHDINEVFDSARTMVRGSSDPATWEEREAKIDEVRKETLALVRAGTAFQHACKEVRKRLKLV